MRKTKCDCIDSGHCRASPRADYICGTDTKSIPRPAATLSLAIMSIWLWSAHISAHRNGANQYFIFMWYRVQEIAQTKGGDDLISNCAHKSIRMEDYNNTNSSNEQNDTDIYQYTNVYLVTVPLLILFSMISVVINIKVLMAVRWIRRPISPTVHISLSLAAADAASSFILGIHILLNNYLRHVFDIVIGPQIVYYIIEMHRLGSIIVTVMHLLALSVNHWLGVLKPLHYTSIMTTRRVTMLIIFLWISPIAYFNGYLFINSKLESSNFKFLDTFSFRIMFSSFFFIPMLAMVFFYTHILVIVMKHQIEWKKLSRSGSKRSKSLTKANSQQRRAMQGSIKAICTTLLILGSCTFGWLPSVIKFILICEEGCQYNADDMNKLISIPMNLCLAHIAYLALILKTMANPIIYSRRMVEIKEATRRMNLAARSIFCHSNERDNYQTDTQSLPFAGSSSVRSTAVYRLNGCPGMHRNTRRSHQNTLV